MNVRCAIAGHKWAWRGNDRPYRCERCRHYDDEPKIAAAAKRRHVFNAWSPVVLRVTRQGSSLTIGVPWHRRLPRLSLRLEAMYSLKRDDHPLGVSVSLTVLRLHAGVTVGGLWENEDGGQRALFRAWADLTTEGWRWIGCWLGHEPREWAPGCVDCERCHATIAYSPRGAARV